jgi:hypothetical protein
MRWKILTFSFVIAILSIHVPRVAAFDWDPITDPEKNMKSSPLDPGAGAVVLFKRGRIDVIEQSSLFWTTRIQTYVRIKVFNDAGREAANVSMDAPKFMRLSKIEGRTILPSGEIIPLDSSKVFHGKAYEGGGHFAILQTTFSLPSVVPGAIIEFQTDEYEDWFYPDPWIFDTNGIGTLDSSLKVTIGPRLLMAQYPLETTVNRISITQSQTVKGGEFDYSIKNLRPIQREPFSLPFRDMATMVLFTPRELGFGGDVYPLIMKWDDVGAEIKKEMDGLEKTEKEAKSKAKELTDKISDPRKKAETLYSYLQQNIVSSDVIGVGIGRTADEILSAKRGDPDEINALFVLMLREAKVDADFVLLATQNWETLVRSFPNRNQFSRAITRVDLKDGPVFADPADAAAPFGDLPWYERGVLGLAVKGSKIQEAAIPAGSEDDNVSTVKSMMQVAKNWTIEGDEEVDMKGAEGIEFRADLMDEAPAKQEERLTDYFAGGNSDVSITEITHPEFRDSSQPFVLKAHLKATLTSEIGQSGLLLNPWMSDQFERPLFKTTVRHSAVRFHNPEKRMMTTTWQLAPEIKVEQLPKEVKIENDVGGFSHSCSQSGNTVTCTRTYSLKKMLLQTSVDYLNAKKFFDDIAKQDQEGVILRAQ